VFAVQAKAAWKVVKGKPPSEKQQSLKAMLVRASHH
jgi:hypothetical protein